MQREVLRLYFETIVILPSELVNTVPRVTEVFFFTCAKHKCFSHESLASGVKLSS